MKCLAQGHTAREGVEPGFKLGQSDLKSDLPGKVLTWCTHHPARSKAGTHLGRRTTCANRNVLAYVALRPFHGSLDWLLQRDA